MIVFFFNDTATTEIYTLSLHDALPICDAVLVLYTDGLVERRDQDLDHGLDRLRQALEDLAGRDLDELCDELLTCMRSEEHTSELQSRQYLVCRLLLEKKESNSSCM